MSEEKKDQDNKDLPEKVEQEVSSEKKSEEKSEEKRAEKNIIVGDFDSVDDDLFSDDEVKDKNKNEIEELPEEIKQKLEKNKQARSKKKLIKKRKKKEIIKVKSGNAYISATYNNTIVSLTDRGGNVISWASAGVAGFKGAKKATPYAAQIIVKIATLKAKEEFGLEEVKVYVSGVGTGREAAVRALNANGLEIVSIKDITAVPHNGCRPKKPRRV